MELHELISEKAVMNWIDTQWTTDDNRTTADTYVKVRVSIKELGVYYDCDISTVSIMESGVLLDSAYAIATINLEAAREVEYAKFVKVD